MDKQYESLSHTIDSIDFFKLHPSYKPIIGTDYSKYRILQISESHYCESITDRDRFGIPYFCQWFTSPCDEIERDILNGNLTQDVVNRVMFNNERYNNFDNPLRTFCDRVLGLGKLCMSKYNENRKLYSHFAYMNYYQIPSFRDKKGFCDSFYSEANREGIATPDADNILREWRKKSNEIIDQVIECIKPTALVFTSVDAWQSYDGLGGKHKSDASIIRSAHPGIPWNKEQPSLNNKTGREAFEEGLERIYGLR